MPFKELSSAAGGTSSGEMRAEVEAARAAQHRRFAGSRTRYNAQMSHKQIRADCKLDDAGANLMKVAMSELGLSARAHDKVLRVARTIADLAASEEIADNHINEAINYRMLDRSLWT